MKRIIAIILTIALMSTGVVFAAASINGTFSGLPIVNVKVNGETLKSDVPGVVLQGRTLLPARAIAESLNAVVTWDAATMTASIIKPEVQMLSMGELVEENDGSWTLKNVGLNNASVGKDNMVNFYYLIGPMAKQLYSYRIVLLSPSGEILTTSATEESVIDNQGLMGIISMDNLTYAKPGQYTFQFQMKYNEKFESVHEAIVTVQ